MGRPPTGSCWRGLFGRAGRRVCNVWHAPRPKQWQKRAHICCAPKPNLPPRRGTQNVMMLNIMIASMTNSFSKVTQVRPSAQRVPLGRAREAPLVAQALWGLAGLPPLVAQQPCPQPAPCSPLSQNEGRGPPVPDVQGGDHRECCSACARAAVGRGTQRASLCASVRALRPPTDRQPFPDVSAKTKPAAAPASRNAHGPQDELEATLPSWLKPGRWFPPFIHILKIHPDRRARGFASFGPVLGAKAQTRLGCTR